MGGAVPAGRYLGLCADRWGCAVSAPQPTPGLIGAAMLEALEVARDWCLAELAHPGVHDPQDLLDTLEAAIELATGKEIPQ